MSEKKSTKQEQSVNQEDAAVKQQTKREDAVIYLGPPIMGVVMPGTVFKNGLTPQLQEVVKELPALSRLLVAMGNVQRARKDLRDPQSAVSICYQSVLDYVKKKGAKG